MPAKKDLENQGVEHGDHLKKEENPQRIEAAARLIAENFGHNPEGWREYRDLVRRVALTLDSGPPPPPPPPPPPGDEDDEVGG